MNALQTFLRGLETDQILDKFRAIWVTCLGTEQASRLNLLQAGVYTVTDVGGAPTFVSGVGGAGGFTATTDAVDTNFPWINGWSGPVDGNCCIFYDSGTNVQFNTISDFGLASFVSLNGFLRTTSNVTTGRIADLSTETIASSVTDSSGLFAFERVGTTKEVYRQGSSIGSVTRAISLSSNQSIRFLGTTAPNTRRTRLFAVSYALGATGQLAFYNRWTQFKTAIGCT